MLAWPGGEGLMSRWREADAACVDLEYWNQELGYVLLVRICECPTDAENFALEYSLAYRRLHSSRTAGCNHVCVCHGLPVLDCSVHRFTELFNCSST